MRRSAVAPRHVEDPYELSLVGRAKSGCSSAARGNGDEGIETTDYENAEVETMTIAERTARVVWEGSLARGAGMLDSGSGAFAQLPVTWAARTETPDGKTSPEELIAAAHATCLTMALALVLGEANMPPERLETEASCRLDEVEGAPRITRVALRVDASVAGLDEAQFQDLAERAAALCPISNALRGNVDLSVEATLVGG